MLRVSDISCESPPVRRGVQDCENRQRTGAVPVRIRQQIDESDYKTRSKFLIETGCLLRRGLCVGMRPTRLLMAQNGDESPLLFPVRRGRS